MEHSASTNLTRTTEGDPFQPTQCLLGIQDHDGPREIVDAWYPLLFLQVFGFQVDLRMTRALTKGGDIPALLKLTVLARFEAVMISKGIFPFFLYTSELHLKVGCMPLSASEPRT